MTKCGRWRYFLNSIRMISCSISGLRAVMHRSFVVPASTGPGNSRPFKFSVFKAPAKRPALPGQIYGEIPAKGPRTPPPSPEVDNNEEQQITRTIWINYLPLFHGGSTWNLASIGPVVSEKTFEHLPPPLYIIYIYIYIYIYIFFFFFFFFLWRWAGLLVFQSSGRLAFVKMYNFLQVVVFLKNSGSVVILCSNWIFWSEYTVLCPVKSG